MIFPPSAETPIGSLLLFGLFIYLFIYWEVEADEHLRAKPRLSRSNTCRGHDYQIKTATLFLDSSGIASFSRPLNPVILRGERWFNTAMGAAWHSTVFSYEVISIPTPGCNHQLPFPLSTRFWNSSRTGSFFSFLIITYIQHKFYCCNLFFSFWGLNLGRWVVAGTHSTTWAMPPALLAVVIFQIELYFALQALDCNLSTFSSPRTEVAGAYATTAKLICWDEVSLTFSLGLAWNDDPANLYFPGSWN
jgi:hypothetical protein